MKTDDLIRALAADHAVAVRPWPVLPRLALLVSLGAAAAAYLLWAAMGARPDLAGAVGSPRVAFKFILALGLAGMAGALAFRAMRPESDPRPWPVLTPILAALAVAVAAELAVLPRSDWGSQLVGRNPLACLMLIPLLSLPLLAAALVALRQGAPGNPRLAGLVAGLCAGGLGAAVWALHCTDDSPLFVATWYASAVAAVALGGAALGSRLLRW